MRRQASGPAEVGEAPAAVHEVLRSPGRPLDAGTRSFMEPRFGHAFGDVRLHTDPAAAASARAVDALAYTVGNHVVFGAGQYAPHLPAGRRLLAHELAHVVQQRAAGERPQKLSIGGPTDRAEQEADHAANGALSGAGGAVGGIAPSAPVLRRACGPAAIGTPGGCTVGPDFGFFVSGFPFFKFVVDCDTFEAGEEARMVSVVTGLPPGTTVEVHGFASVDGPAAFNDNLACARALQAQSALAGPFPGGGAVPSIVGVFNHGPTPGPAPDRRGVVIKTNTPPPQPKCGPDATDWFVLQVNAALTNPIVLLIQSLLATASRKAAAAGGSATELAEASVTTAVELQESNLGAAAPARGGAIVGQLAAGTRSQLNAALFTLKDPRAALDAGANIAVAALLWKSLVDHGAIYDFKAHTDSMRNPKSAHCPDEGCPPGEVGIITLCPGTAPQNCYESDLPGNLFYALIGRFIGWSELTLQLGSQLAELTDPVRPGHPAVTWDSPEDTAAIHLGFALGAKLPLTKSDLCGAVVPARGSLDARTGCEDCLEPTPSKIH